MRDHNYTDETGKKMPVSQMCTEDIIGILADGGCRINDSDGYADPVTSVMERLRIELLIRHLGL